MATLLDLARDFLAYHARADGLVHRALAALDTPTPAHPEMLKRAREVAAHVQVARRLWLDRLHGRSPTAIELFPDWPIAQTAARASQLDADWRAYIDGLSPADLEIEHRYTSTDGDPFASRTRDVLAHVFGHTTYHRGQLALFTRSAGGQPPASDLITLWPVREPGIVLGLVELARALERHEQEATRRVLSSLESIPTSERQAPEAVRARSVMHHLTEVRHWWLHVMGGVESWPAREGFVDKPVDELNRYAATVHDWFTDFLDAAQPATFAAVRTVNVPGGAARTWNLAVVAMHVYDHGAYHRGQIATLVTRSGGKRALTDYIFTTRREV